MEILGHIPSIEHLEINGDVARIYEDEDGPEEMDDNLGKFASSLGVILRTKSVNVLKSLSVRPFPLSYEHPEHWETELDITVNEFGVKTHDLHGSLDTLHCFTDLAKLEVPLWMLLGARLLHPTEYIAHVSVDHSVIAQVEHLYQKLPRNLAQLVLVGQVFQDRIETVLEGEDNENPSETEFVFEDPEVQRMEAVSERSRHFTFAAVKNILDNKRTHAPQLGSIHCEEGSFERERSSDMEMMRNLTNFGISQDVEILFGINITVAKRRRGSLLNMAE